MMAVLVYFVYQYYVAPKVVTKKAVAKEEFLPNDKKKN